VVRGTVTDFLLFYVGEYQWPAFNVADSAITVGAALLILEMLKPGKQPART
jgi:signal peptidase II